MPFEDENPRPGKDYLLQHLSREPKEQRPRIIGSRVRDVFTGDNFFPDEKVGFQIPSLTHCGTKGRKELKKRKNSGNIFLFSFCFRNS